MVVSVANSDQYGNNARIAPGARVDDGHLDLVALPPVGVAGAASLALRLFAGGLERHRGVVRHAGSAFTIVRPAAGVMHVDGEVRETAAEITVAVLPQSLRILVPA
jgi:diacylglycerol kinase family enzyme